MLTDNQRHDQTVKCQCLAEDEHDELLGKGENRNELEIYIKKAQNTSSPWISNYTNLLTMPTNNLFWSSLPLTSSPPPAPPSSSGMVEYPAASGTLLGNKLMLLAR